MTGVQRAREPAGRVARSRNGPSSPVATMRAVPEQLSASRCRRKRLATVARRRQVVVETRQAGARARRARGPAGPSKPTRSGGHVYSQSAVSLGESPDVAARGFTGSRTADERSTWQPRPRRSIHRPLVLFGGPRRDGRGRPLVDPLRRSLQRAEIRHHSDCDDDHRSREREERGVGR